MPAWGATPATRLTTPVAPSSVDAATPPASVVIDGHGYGHGIGLSQWGAYGYAVDLGWSSAQILDHYYGGTVAGAVAPGEQMTVRLMRLDDQQTAVVIPDAETYEAGDTAHLLVQ